MRYLYTLLLLLALPFASLVVLWRGIRERHYWQGWGQRFGLGVPLPGASPGLWVHAVSVGEVQASASLVAALCRIWPQLPMVVTSATPSGRARAQSAFGNGIEARFAPYDLPWCLRAALRRFRPALLIVLETEVWPNLLDQCMRAGVPVLIASARLSERSCARWRKFRALLHPAMESSVTVAAQSLSDAERFESLGVPRENVHVSGNLKFDRGAAPAVRLSGQALRAKYGATRPLWVAGSTHAGEEEAALAAHAALRGARGDAVLVLAPRHSPRFDEVAALLEKSGEPWMRHSQAATAAAGTPERISVLLLDTLGELENFYAAADVAFVGGSLVPTGGHNLLEPAALGVAVITGPGHHNQPEIARLLNDRRALQVVRNPEELAADLIRLMGDPTERARLAEAARATLSENRGALERLLELVKECLAVQGLAPAPTLVRSPTVRLPVPASGSMAAGPSSSVASGSESASSPGAVPPAGPTSR